MVTWQINSKNEWSVQIGVGAGEGAIAGSVADVGSGNKTLYCYNPIFRNGFRIENLVNELRLFFFIHFHLKYREDNPDVY